MNKLQLTFCYSFVPGKFGKAIQFEVNTDGGVGQKTGAMLTPFNNGAITVSTWFNDANKQRLPVCDGVHSCFPAVAIIQSDNTMNVGICQAGVACLSAVTPALTLNVWTHFAMTYANNGTLRVYINGVQVATASGALTMTPAASVTNLHFASSAFTASGNSHCNGLAPTYYQGLMDEFQIYSKELSAADIRRLMLNYSPGEH